MTGLLWPGNPDFVRHCVENSSPAHFSTILDYLWQRSTFFFWNINTVLLSCELELDQTDRRSSLFNSCDTRWFYFIYSHSLQISCSLLTAQWSKECLERGFEAFHLPKSGSKAAACHRCSLHLNTVWQITIPAIVATKYIQIKKNNNKRRLDGLLVLVQTFTSRLHKYRQ